MTAYTERVAMPGLRCEQAGCNLPATRTVHGGPSSDHRVWCTVHAIDLVIRLNDPQEAS